MSTKAYLFIAPIQDILFLDDSSRLNKPGTTKNNWKWKLNRPLEEIEDNMRMFSELGNNFGRILKQNLLKIIYQEFDFQYFESL